MSRRAVLAAAGGASLAGLVGCSSSSTAAAAPVEQSSDETLVMIIRHAEKPKGSHAPYGVTSAGATSDSSLTVQGWTRAGALVELFDPASGPVRTGLLRPKRVVAAHPDSGSERPLETVTPLAARLGTKIDTTWSVGQEKAAAAGLAALSGVTLVAWEHKHIPDLASAFRHVSPTPPSHWPGHRFDVVWCLRRTGESWTFFQVPELLLAGDSNSVI